MHGRCDADEYGNGRGRPDINAGADYSYPA